MIGFAVSFVVLLVVVGIHYEGLRLVSRLLAHMPAQRFAVAFAMIGALIAHMTEILVFALAIGAMVATGLGALDPPDYDFVDLMYFSTVSYTSLGVGDVVPLGEMRPLASVEALTGLVMIAWTASFSFMQMEHFWGRRRP